MRFRTTIELGGKTATGFEVPPEVVESLGGGRRPAVHVSIGHLTYRSTVASMGGRFMVPLSADRRSAGGLAAGDDVEVILELDTTPREVEVPPDLAAALDADAAVRARFDAMSFTNRNESVRAVESAKTEPTRQRRIAKVVADLSAGLIGRPG
jgi:Bacteriocin-protection, YdeI or OmpD-Associated/Domain of unknown function (DUF1905)